MLSSAISRHKARSKSNRWTPRHTTPAAAAADGADRPHQLQSYSYACRRYAWMVFCRAVNCSALRVHVVVVSAAASHSTPNGVDGQQLPSATTRLGLRLLVLLAVVTGG